MTLTQTTSSSSPQELCAVSDLQTACPASDHFIGLEAIGIDSREARFWKTTELPTIRPQQRAHRFLSFRGTIGLDVLVESQHVAWVVPFLDLHEASIVRPIARADQLVTRIAQLVDVHSMRKGL